MVTKAVTDITIQNLKPKDKLYKFAVGGGLYIAVTPTGGKLWRWNYSFGPIGQNGRRLRNQKTLSIGPYPFVSLADARRKHFEAKGMVPPSAAKKQEQAAAEQRDAENTFKAVALE